MEIGWSYFPFHLRFFFFSIVSILTDEELEKVCSSIQNASQYEHLRNELGIKGTRDTLFEDLQTWRCWCVGKQAQAWNRRATLIKALENINIRGKSK